MDAVVPAVPLHHLLVGLPFLSLSPLIRSCFFFHSFVLRPPRATDRGDSFPILFSHMFRMLTRCAVFIAGVVTLAAVAASKEVEFKHHNNTELAETLQKVHNR